MVMVLRKANIIFGCIKKKSILYKIRGRSLFFIAGIWFWAGREVQSAASRRRGCTHFPREPTSGLRVGIDLGFCL